MKHSIIAADLAAIEVVACNGERVMVTLHQLAQAYAGLKERPVTRSIDLIQKACARHFGVSLTEIRSALRDANIVRARHVAIYLARELTEYSLPQIARRFGDRDHTTALYAARKIARLIETDQEMRADIEMLRFAVAAGEPNA